MRLIFGSFVALLALSGAAGSEQASPISAVSEPRLRIGASDAKCKLVPMGWASVSPDSASRDPIVKNSLTIDQRGGSSWNEFPIDTKTAQQFIELTSTMKPAPVLFIHADRGAPCDVVRDTLSYATRMLRCTPATCRFGWAQVKTQDHLLQM